MTTSSIMLTQNLNKDKYMSKQRHLICITGMSPQVVTETIYALAHEDEAPIATTVTIITTAEGAKQAHLKLLSGQHPYFNLLKQEYGLAHFHLDASNIHIVKNEQGEELSDIRTKEDNQHVADAIVEVVRKATENDDSEVHVSIAGGRKTMGFYAGYALSMFGREQDRLSHVLVSEHYENHPDFFYPTKKTQVITTRDNKALDTSKAEITLAHIPFVRMRGELPKDALINKIGYSQAVDFINAPPKITLNLKDNSLAFSGIKVELNASLTVFYIWFIQQKLLNDGELITGPSEYTGELELAYGKTYLALFDRYIGNNDMPERSYDVLKNEGLLSKPFAVNISKIKKSLEESLGKAAAKTYLINNVGSRGKSSYQLSIDPEAIDVIGGRL